MTFDNNLSYFISPDNRYGLQVKNINTITNEDFTFITTFKVDWEKLKDPGGVLCKSGMHMGIFVFNDGTNCYIQGIAWFKIKGENRPIDVAIQIPKEKENEILSVKISLNKKNKLLTLKTDWKTESKRYEGELVDYKNSWVWLGCANGHESCSPEHRNYFYGEIFHASIYDIDTQDENVENALFYTNFDEKTFYKIKDLSGNGNHLTKYDTEWFVK